MAMRLTDLARKTLEWATYEANMGGDSTVSPDHLMEALIRYGGPSFARFADTVPLEEWRSRLEKKLREAPGPVRPRAINVDGLPPFGTDLETVIRVSAEFAAKSGASKLERDHFVVGIATEGTSTAAALLREAGITPEVARAAFLK